MKIENSYLFNGIEGLLLDSHLDLLKGIKPLEECNGVGFYSIDELKEFKVLELIEPSMVNLTEEDSYCNGCYSEEIVIDWFTSMENDEKLSFGWVGKKWSECDRYERELLTDTSKYHDWTSSRTSFIEYCRREKIDKATARDEWNSIVDQYKGLNHYNLDEPNFDRIWALIAY